MKISLRPAVLALVLAALTAPIVSAPAIAGPIESACLRSNRKEASRQLCNCIQQVADMTLRGSDQRKAAKFFRDPDQAQKVKMSKSKSDDAFWDRYQSFGAQAEAYCAY